MARRGLLETGNHKMRGFPLPAPGFQRQTIGGECPTDTMEQES